MASRAYSATLAKFEATEGKPHRFRRSLLVIDYEREDPEAVAFADNCRLDAADFLRWAEHAEFNARVLEHRDCSKELREAVEVIYTDLMNDSKVTWTTPEVMRVQLPLILLDYYNKRVRAGGIQRGGPCL
jgi:hypothetical protein